MKLVNQKAVQGCAGKFFKGVGIKLGTAVLGAACYVVAFSPVDVSAGSGAPVSQLKFLQVLAQLTGESGQFSASSKASDYVQWAKNKGLNGNWQPSAALNSDTVAATLVQLYGLNPKKYAGDVYKVLEREGIIIPKSSVVTSSDLASFIDSAAFANRTGALASVVTSPNKPGNSVGLGLGLGNNPNGIPSPNGNPPPNPANPKRTGNPHIAR